MKIVALGTMSKTYVIDLSDMQNKSIMITNRAMHTVTLCRSSQTKPLPVEQLMLIPSLGRSPPAPA